MTGPGPTFLASNCPSFRHRWRRARGKVAGRRCRRYRPCARRHRRHALGAVGVQVGTAYLLCPESTICAIHHAALKSEAAHRTALTNLFTGRPARGIMSYLMRELGPINSGAPAFSLATSAIAPLRTKAEAESSGDFSPLWSDQNAIGCVVRSRHRPLTVTLV